jgi:hypothetical protein
MRWIFLACLDDLAILNAAGADAQSLSRTLHNGPHALQIDVPAAVCNVVCVTDAMAELRSTTAQFTNLRHKTRISFGL